jgi:hypothetical protein
MCCMSGVFDGLFVGGRLEHRFLEVFGLGCF